MNLNEKTVVVTGGAGGIGKALSVSFANAGANVVVADRLESAARQTADEIGGLAVSGDVSKETDVQHIVEQAEQHFGPIDLFCSNAGVCFGEPDNAASASNTVWQTCWDVHVMAHVFAARAVLPGMIERGHGYLLQMASAAGLLNQIGDAAYSATKHAAVGFAEALAITHADDGIKVSVICPQYVATPMIGYNEADDFSEYVGVISPQQLADTVLKGVEEERFLILPHPDVAKYFQFKAGDYDRWLGGMRKLRRKIVNEIGTTRLQDMHKLV